MHDECLTALHYALGSSMHCATDETVDVNEGPAVDIRFYLDELWDQKRDV